jgi:hypothetical protein
VLSDLDEPTIIEFLDYLRTEQGDPIFLRSTRLGQIQAFLEFASPSDPTALPTIQPVMALSSVPGERVSERRDGAPPAATSVVKTSDLSDVRVRFGKRLRDVREEIDLSVEELAKRVKLFPHDVEATERGLGDITLRSIELFAQALGVSLADLMPPAERKE